MCDGHAVPSTRRHCQLHLKRRLQANTTSARRRGTHQEWSWGSVVPISSWACTIDQRSIWVPDLLDEAEIDVQADGHSLCIAKSRIQKREDKVESTGSRATFHSKADCESATTEAIRHLCGWVIDADMVWERQAQEDLDASFKAAVIETKHSRP